VQNLGESIIPRSEPSTNDYHSLSNNWSNKTSIITDKEPDKKSAKEEEKPGRLGAAEDELHLVQPIANSHKTSEVDFIEQKVNPLYTLVLRQRLTGRHFLAPPRIRLRDLVCRLIIQHGPFLVGDVDLKACPDNVENGHDRQRRRGQTSIVAVPDDLDGPIGDEIALDREGRDGRMCGDIVELFLGQQSGLLVTDITERGELCEREVEDEVRAGVFAVE